MSTPTPFITPAPALRPSKRVTARRSRCGFASMDPLKQQEIARLGGKAAQRSGNCRHFTNEEARIAGRKGGSIGRRGPSKPKPQADE